MKNYAGLVKKIFSNGRDFDEEKLNKNAEFVETMQEKLESLYYLEYVAMDQFLAENKKYSDFADYIRENAVDVADSIFASAFRKMRHPSRSREIYKYIKEEE